MNDIPPLDDIRLCPRSGLTYRIGDVDDAARACHDGCHAVTMPATVVPGARPSGKWAFPTVIQLCRICLHEPVVLREYREDPFCHRCDDWARKILAPRFKLHLRYPEACPYVDVAKASMKRALIGSCLNGHVHEWFMRQLNPIVVTLRWLAPGHPGLDPALEDVMEIARRSWTRQRIQYKAEDFILPRAKHDFRWHLEERLYPRMRAFLDEYGDEPRVDP